MVLILKPNGGNTANLPGANEMVTLPNGNKVPAWSDVRESSGGEECVLSARYIMDMYIALYTTESKRPFPPEANVKHYRLLDYLAPFHEKTDPIFVQRQIYPDGWNAKYQNYFHDTMCENDNLIIADLNREIDAGNVELAKKINHGFFGKILENPKFLEQVSKHAPKAYADIMDYKNQKMNS